MKILFPALAILFFLNGALFARPKSKTYPVIFVENFEDSLFSKNKWNPRTNYSFTEGKGGRGIFLESTGGSKIITTRISADTIKGGTLILQANVRGENISHLPNPWNGIKVMLNIILSDGTSVWPQVDFGTGTFDWQNGSVLVNIPASASDIILYIGLDKCIGKLWIDDVIIKLAKSPSSYPESRCPELPVNKYHALPALRGAMVGTLMTEADFKNLGQDWKANVIRWQLGGTRYPQGLASPGYDEILDAELVKLDQALKWCKAYQMTVIVDLHSLSLGWQYSSAAQNKLIEVWKKLAVRYKNESTVWAYDIVGEPAVNDGNWGAEGIMIWDDLAEILAREIREVDYNKPIIIQPAYAAPASFEFMRPADFSIPNLIYSVHMYEPLAFTHQTLYNYTQSFVYPGQMGSVYYDKKKLKELLLPVLAFQDKYRVPILVGEFSAIRWAPSGSAYNYIKDCIEIFEEYNWDWCYHAFREYNGWSVEHSEDINDQKPTSSPNGRQLLLRSYFEKNKKITSAAENNTRAESFDLLQNFPNPFNPSTRISYSIPADGFVLLEVFDVLGNRVCKLVEEEKKAGNYNVSFTSEHIPAGVYFYRLQSGNYMKVKKLVAIK